MKNETIISLVKESEKIRSIRSRNSYRQGWGFFIFSIIFLGSLYMQAPVKGLEWVSAIKFIAGLLVCLQSFYIIIRHLINKKFTIIIEALLENKNIEKPEQV